MTPSAKIAVVAGAALLAALAVANLTQSPVHSSTEGPLRVSDEWGFYMGAPDGDVVTFAGLDPCLNRFSDASLIEVRPQTVVGNVETVGAHLRYWSRNEQAHGGHFSAAHGSPPEPRIEDVVLGGQYIPFEDRPVIDQPCDSRLTADPAVDLTVSFRITDPTVGGGVDGVLIEYEAGGRRRTLLADVQWYVCGTDEPDVCPDDSS